MEDLLRPISLLEGDSLSGLDALPSSSTGRPKVTVSSATLTLTTSVVALAAPTSSANRAEGTGFTSTSSAPATMSSTGHEGSQAQSTDDNRSTVVIIATVLSIAAVIIIALMVWALLRYRRRRGRLFSRGITPIDDEEIETWKGHRTEKIFENSRKTFGSPIPRPASRGHQKQESTSSTKKPPSVIVYARKSEEQWARSPSTPGQAKMSWDGGRLSYDKDLPFTPIQARAPNAREGLTDDTVPGDDPFIQGPKRHASRLYKSPRLPQQAHTRNRSSRSSTSLHRQGDSAFSSDSDGHEASYELSQGQSPVHPFFSSPPPRLSLADDWPGPTGGLSPRPLVRPDEIGRAIG